MAKYGHDEPDSSKVTTSSGQGKVQGEVKDKVPTVKSVFSSPLSASPFSEKVDKWLPHWSNSQQQLAILAKKTLCDLECLSSLKGFFFLTLKWMTWPRPGVRTPGRIRGHVKRLNGVACPRRSLLRIG